MIKLMPDKIENQIEEAGIIAVLVIENADKAVKLAQTLVNSGITAMELTLRTDAALDALQQISKSVPEMLAGAGTVLTPSQVQQVKTAGADFAVAPGYNQDVLKSAKELHVPYAPGVCIPSEIEATVTEGCRVLKYFHAEGMGGLKYLKGINNPYKYLNLRYIPLGGVSIDNMKTYLEAPEIIALGGSWIAPASLIKEADWDSIARNADEAVKILREVRGK